MTVQQYLSYLDEMIQPTAPLFRLVPPDKIDWKPTENAFTLGQLMAHIALSFAFYGSGIALGDWTVKSMRDLFIRNRHLLETFYRSRFIRLGFAQVRRCYSGCRETHPSNLTR